MKTLIDRIRDSIELEIIETQDLVKSDVDYPEISLPGVIASRKSFIYGLKTALRIIEKEVEEEEMAKKVQESLDEMLRCLDEMSKKLT